MYVTANERETFEQPFDLSKVPIVTREQADAEERQAKLTSTAPTLKAPSAGPDKPSTPGGKAANGAATSGPPGDAQRLLQVPEFKSYGPLLKSSSAVELTESETEYVVTAIKHIFNDHVVLQFEIGNTVPEVLEGVSVLALPSDEEDGEAGLEEELIVPITKLTTEEPGTVYVSFRRTQGEASFPVTSFTNLLKFTRKEIDPSTGEAEETGYEDEYQVEDLELNGSDYVVPTFAGSFNHIWEQVGASGEEEVETLHLSSVKSIAGTVPRHISRVRLWLIFFRPTDATEQLTKTLCLQPLEGTDVPLQNSTHALKLFGKTVAGGKVAALVKMAYSAKTGVTTQITVRSEEEGVAALIIASVV